MAIQKSQALSEAVKRRWREFWETGLVNEEMLQDYSKANDESLHSRLQGLMILAGWDAGLATFPEFKVRLKNPIDRRALGDIRATQRYQRTVTVDVGYFDRSQLVGIGEVITLDMLPNANPNLHGITTYHKLRHLVRDKIPFVLIVVSLPQRILRAPHWGTWQEWRDAQRRDDECAKAAFVKRQFEHWVRLVEELVSELGCEATCLRLMEGGNCIAFPN